MNSVYKDDSLTLHTDLYQINMMKTYWETGVYEKKAIFEAYFRKLPFENGYAIFAGLERIVRYIEQLRFSKTDIEYLRGLGHYPEEFLTYLENFEFKGSIRSAVEGELVFANEPLVQVEGTLAECQLIETALLNIPEVVCYKGNWISYHIAKRIIKLKYISLVNLIMDKPVVTELIQGDFTKKNLKIELDKLSTYRHRYEVFKDYVQLREKLGGEGASEKTASLILKQQQ